MRKKCYRLIFSSLELNWADLGAHLKISYWIWLWYIKIDRFHGLSIKWVQKWKNRTGSLLAQVSHFGAHFRILWLMIYQNDQRYINAVCQIWVFLELSVVKFLSVSHLVVQKWALEMVHLKNINIYIHLFVRNIAAILE